MSWSGSGTGSKDAAIKALEATCQNQRPHLGEKGEKVLDACIVAIKAGCENAPGDVSVSTNGHISPDGSGSFNISGSLNIPQSGR